MQNLEKFKEIQPYSDDEVPHVIAELVRERKFLGFVKMFFPELSTREIIRGFQKIKTIKDFQINFIYEIVDRIIKDTRTELSYKGIENIKNSQPAIFISNHRDIILDSAFLNYILTNHGMETTEIAIGSNLLIMNWIEDLARLNKTFIVIRSAPKKKLYHYSYRLSEYIRYAITEKKVSIWIAQREGRTKDGNDKTQLSLLKMLGLSGEKNYVEKIKDLNIIPLSISYEYEPCDVGKVRELYKKQTENYKKTKLDDLTSMVKSFESYKGKVNLAFGIPVNKGFLHNNPQFENKNDFYQKLAQYIDNQIYLNYELYPNNFIAADIFFETTEYSKYYTKEQKQKFIQYMENAINQIEGDKNILRKMFLKIYAIPVKNHFLAKQK